MDVYQKLDKVLGALYQSKGWNGKPNLCQNLWIEVAELETYFTKLTDDKYISQRPKEQSPYNCDEVKITFDGMVFCETNSFQNKGKTPEELGPAYKIIAKPKLDPS